MSRRPHDETELVELLRSVDEPAPAALHERVQTLLAGHAAARPRRRLPSFELPRRPVLAGALAGAAAVIVALVLAAGGGGGAAGPSPSLRAASALTLGPATAKAPAESSANRGQLTAAVDHVAFPYWEESLGWRAVGQRRDSIGGRGVRTVFYADDRGQRIGYAILAGTPPPAVGGGQVAWRGKTEYRLIRVAGAEVIVWTRGGRLCVVSGRGVNDTTLLRLASWGERSAAA